ncbi:MAG: cephalosporin hydroxylase family protein [Verrucomicrobiales bacterium]|nr:cephalosporin hydroxylase family protein [Verrucomicrobiales bacterium]
MQNHDPKDPNKIAAMAADGDLQRQAREVFLGTCRYNYSYNFKWLGRPIIQYPQDIVAMQEIIWEVKPALIVETGIAHGGSLIFYASMLELIGGEGRVVGIDVDIRAHNRVEIECHPMFKRITMLQGSSVDESIVAQVRKLSAGRRPVLVALDSNHSRAHVLRELQLYAPLVTKGSYLVVFDTIAEEMTPELLGNRPWGRGNSPKTAVHEFVRTTDRFVIDKEIEHRLILTVAPDGYLKCVKD